ncbi:M20 family metallopeptidase [Candidatus Allofournierella merdipullorum]|uniref:M20 metallopeptidase family protein n=1 Tax=Candidatus Allofournierella merdipullorum TaxID=2838595 RepID=UPI00374FB3A3
MNKLLERAKELQPELVENRRWLHSYAEVGFELTETCAFVEEKLRELGYEPRRMSKAGVVGTLGKPGGKTILLRADMDALPMKEESGLAFAAQGDAAHTCGHDLHTAMLLGAAKLLEDGILEDPHVDAAFSMHIWSNAPYTAGTFFSRKGALMSSCDTVTVTVKGTHGSMPQDGVDPINAGVHIYQAFENLLAREIPPFEQCTLTIGQFQSGSAANVLPETAQLVGTLRTVSEDTRARMKQRIEAICAGVGQAFGVQVKVTFTQGIPCVYNAPAFTESVMECVEELTGRPVGDMEVPLTGSDDWSEISQKVDSCYMLLSAGAAEEGYPWAQHNPKVCFNEDAMYEGAAAFCAVALDWLRKNG